MTVPHDNEPSPVSIAATSGIDLMWLVLTVLVLGTLCNWFGILGS